MAIGILSLGFAIVTMTSGPSVFDSSPQEFERQASSQFRSVALFGFGGIVLLAVGSKLTRLGFLRAAAELVATETEGAVEHVGAAAGRGWSSGAGTVQVVKVKCRSCGFLETEDAAYCSHCGKTV
ncbi:MAG: hypothetical protein QOI63_366 [Thermoplasmata archaeon]|nr:hypothetical protein [Thermoplasmata archaeon]